MMTGPTGLRTLPTGLYFDVNSLTTAFAETPGDLIHLYFSRAFGPRASARPQSLESPET